MLKLTIGDISTLITKFAEDGYDRILVDVGDTEYSIVGTPVDTGAAYYPKYIWSINAFLTESQWFAAFSIYQEQQKRRRGLFENYRIILIDNIQKIIEPSPRRRALAPGTTETINSGNMISYYSQFNVRMLQPTYKKTRSTLYPYLFTCTLKELDEVI